MSRQCLWLALLGCVGCDLEYPEVVIANKTAEHLELRNPSFSGCVWERVLGYGETTSVARCLPGSDRVYFQKLDVAAYCRQQAPGSAVAAACSGDAGGEVAPAEVGQGLAIPTFFNYRTVSVKRVELGEFRVFEVTLDDMEQDFSVPGPYGH